MRAALYLRVSTDRQDCANQVPNLERYSAARGWTVAYAASAAPDSGPLRVAYVEDGPKHARIAAEFALKEKTGHARCTGAPAGRTMSTSSKRQSSATWSAPACVTHGRAAPTTHPR